MMSGVWCPAVIAAGQGAGGVVVVQLAVIMSHSGVSLHNSGSTTTAQSATV